MADKQNPNIQDFPDAGKLRRLLEGNKSEATVKKAFEQTLNKEYDAVQEQLQENISFLNKNVTDISKQAVELSQALQDIASKAKLASKISGVETESKKADAVEEKIKSVKSSGKGDDATIKELAKVLRSLKNTIDKDKSVKVEKQVERVNFLKMVGLDLPAVVNAASGGNKLVGNLVSVTTELAKQYRDKKSEQRRIIDDPSSRKMASADKDKEQPILKSSTVMGAEDLANATEFMRDTSSTKDAPGSTIEEKHFERLYNLNYEMWGTLLEISEKQDTTNSYLEKMFEIDGKSLEQAKAARFDALENVAEKKPDQEGILGIMPQKASSNTDGGIVSSIKEQAGNWVENAVTAGLGATLIPKLLGGGGAVAAISGAIIPIAIGTLTAMIGTYAIRSLFKSLNDELAEEENYGKERDKVAKQALGLKQDAKRLRDEAAQLIQANKDPNLSPITKETNANKIDENLQLAKQEQEKALRQEIDDLFVEMRRATEKYQNEQDDFFVNQDTLDSNKGKLDNLQKILQSKKRQLADIKGGDRERDFSSPSSPVPYGRGTTQMPGPVATSPGGGVTDDKDLAYAESFRNKMSPEVFNAIKKASDESGVDLGYMLSQAAQESGFNPNAKAGTSSASGLYQFIDSTAKDQMGKLGINPVDRNKPEVQAQLAANYALENKRAIENVTGREATPTDLYLGHFMGTGGASKFLKTAQKNPNAIAADIFPDQAASNRGIFYDKTGRPLSVAEVYSKLDKKVGSRSQAFGTVYAKKSTPGINPNAQIDMVSPSNNGDVLNNQYAKNQDLKNRQRETEQASIVNNIANTNINNGGGGNKNGGPMVEPPRTSESTFHLATLQTFRSSGG